MGGRLQNKKGSNYLRLSVWNTEKVANVLSGIKKKGIKVDRINVKEVEFNKLKE